MNFLKTKSQTQTFWFILAILAVAFSATILPPLWSISAAIFLILLIFFNRHLALGMLLLIFLFPYTGLIVDLSGVQALRNVPFFNQLNAPLVDVFAVILFLAWGIDVIGKIKTDKRIKLYFWGSFLLFFLSGAISLLHVESAYFWSSAKYLVRVVLFFYAALFIPVISILVEKNKTGEEDQEGRRKIPLLLLRVLQIMYWTGLLSALMGLASFFVVPVVGFPRATPFAFFGIAPLGVNHNLLAETLVATIPAGFFLWWWMRGESQESEGKNFKKLYLWGTVLQIAIALLTFARTAWLALAAEILVFLIFWKGFHKENQENKKDKFWEKWWWIFILAVPLLILFLLTIGTQVVQESTAARMDMVRVSWFYFEQSPLIGQGIGTFVNSLWGIRAFLLDYGEPLEAHGVVWKLLFEQGVFGLLSFVFFVGMILRTIFLGIWRAKDHEITRKVVAVMAMAMAVGMLVYELFNTTYYSSKLWVPLAVAVGAVLTVGNQAANSRRE